VLGPEPLVLALEPQPATSTAAQVITTGAVRMLSA
jgi:hypothetical protein